MKFRVFDKGSQQYITDYPDLCITEFGRVVEWDFGYTQFDKLRNVPDEALIELSLERQDCNGKEIFEGDIVRFNHASKYTKKEYWNPIFHLMRDNFGFKLRHIGGGKNSDTAEFNFKHYTSSWFEILGNIHDIKIETAKIIINSKTGQVIVNPL